MISLKSVNNNGRRLTKGVVVMVKRLTIMLLACIAILSATIVSSATSEIWTFEMETEYVISSSKNTPYTFTIEILERKAALTAGELAGITITELPKADEGLLILKSQLVQPYQRLSREEINQLIFIPVYGSNGASFTFIPETEQAAITVMTINLLDSPNIAPIASDSRYATMKNMGFTGYIRASDPEGDDLEVMLIKAPSKGTVTFTNTAFTYTPYTGKAGDDSFIYCVVDSFGNLSNESSVDISIEVNKNDVNFADMNNNAYHYSAIKAHEANLIGGEQIGALLLFYPENEIKRGEFLVMLTAAAGLESDLTACINTGLSNDASLKMWVKPYVDIGLKKGIIDDNFDFGETLTRAQAVEMIDKAIDLEDVKNEVVYIKDIGSVPNEYLQSYINLISRKMLNLYDGNAYPNAPLTRDFAADLLYALYCFEN